jgi:hypothetical protein
LLAATPTDQQRTRTDHAGCRGEEPAELGTGERKGRSRSTCCYSGTSNVGATPNRTGTLNLWGSTLDDLAKNVIVARTCATNRVVVGSRDEHATHGVLSTRRGSAAR